MRSTRALFAALLLMVVVGLADAEPRKGASVEGITEYHLDNGLRVLLFPDDSKPVVTVNATYLVGSRHEGYGESGMAHLLEHMLFKGTPRHGKIWKELQDHGAQFNGSTSSDRTNYFETLPASEENLLFALDLEADRMVNSFVAKADLESEFTVVRNEFEMGENSPIGVLSERVMSTAYLWHNYGKSTIGSREDIERVPIERLQAFYRTFYQPDNCVLIVAGRFDEARTLAHVARLFGAIPRPTRVLQQTWTWEPTQDGEREVTLRRAGDVQGIQVAYHVCAATHEDFEPLRVLADVLDADQTGRLFQVLVAPGLATRVSSGVQPMHDPGMFSIGVQARPDQPLGEIRKRLIETLDGLGATTFTTEEVERSKRAAARSFEQLMSDPNRVGVAISEAAACGDWRLMFLRRDRLAKVTPADVQRVAARYLKAGNRTIGTFVPDATPERVTIPPTPDAASLVHDYVGGAAMSKGAAFEASYAAIEAHTTRATLPVGMKLALLPRETRNDQLAIAMNFRYGSEAELTGKVEAAAFVGRMLMQGTKRKSRREIQDALDALSARVSVGSAGGGGRGRRRGGSGGGGTLGVIEVSIGCGRAQLPAVLDLTAEILREPAFPAEEFERVKRETLAMLEERLSDPQALAMSELQRRLHPFPATDVRYVPTPAEQMERVQAVTLDQVKAMYENLVGASAAEAAAVGDFDAAELTALLGKHFGEWPSPKPFERVVRKALPARAGPLVLETPDKANAVFGLGIGMEVRDDDPDYPALFLANYILGGSANSRFFNRIRQAEGLSYSCGTALQVGALDRVGVFTGSGICAPENAERALAAALEETARLIEKGVSQAELDDARKGYRQAIEVELSSDAGVAGLLATGLFHGRTLKFAEDLLQRIDALTPADPASAFAKFVKPADLITVRAGDFARAAKAGETPRK